jgi:hypothetical protein
VFEALCREGQMTSDFRMGLMTHKADVVVAKCMKSNTIRYL